MVYIYKTKKYSLSKLDNYKEIAIAMENKQNKTKQNKAKHKKKQQATHTTNVLLYQLIIKVENIK